MHNMLLVYIHGKGKFCLIVIYYQLIQLFRPSPGELMLLCVSFFTRWFRLRHSHSSDPLLYPVFVAFTLTVDAKPPVIPRMCLLWSRVYALDLQYTVGVQVDTHPTRHSPNAILMLDQRLWRWPNSEPTLEECIMFEGKSLCQYKRGVSCFDIPAVIHRVQFVLKILCCALKPSSKFIQWLKTKYFANQFQVWVANGRNCVAFRYAITNWTLLPSVCLQNHSQLRARAKNFELCWNY